MRYLSGWHLVISSSQADDSNWIGVGQSQHSVSHGVYACCAWRRLDERKLLDWEEAFRDATLITARKKGLAISKTRRGKGAKCMVAVNGRAADLSERNLRLPRSPSTAECID
jgi:hypothetical protein